MIRSSPKPTRGCELVSASLAVASTFLIGCGGGSQSMPSPAGPTQRIAASTALDAQLLGRLGVPSLNAAGTRAQPDAAPSWMAPDAKKNDLLYISDLGPGDVYVYSYPAGALEGTLTGFHSPWGECVDKAGDVFITNASSFQILEYAHGGTVPIATLSDPNEYPVDCSVDPTTGNLAVANQESTNGFGSVSIYANAQGTPTNYSNPKMLQDDSLTFDGAGNLFVVGNGGQRGGQAFRFAELPKGGNQITEVFLNQHIQNAGAVRWDGNYVTVGDSDANVIYRFTVHGRRGTEVGTTPLDGANFVQLFWVGRGRIVGPNFFGASVAFWTYPDGRHLKALTGFSQPIGATVSDVKP